MISISVVTVIQKRLLLASFEVWLVLVLKRMLLKSVDFTVVLVLINANILSRKQRQR